MVTLAHEQFHPPGQAPWQSASVDENPSEPTQDALNGNAWWKGSPPSPSSKRKTSSAGAPDTHLPNGITKATSSTAAQNHLSRRVKNICCIGAGYVGGTTSAVVANKCHDINVEVVDLNAKRIEAWESHNLPIYEPNLYDQVQAARDGSTHQRNLFFSTDVDGAIQRADLIFLAVNTPTKSVGVGAGVALDIGYLESAVRRIASVSTSGKIIVEKSTTPCRTAEFIREILAANSKPGMEFQVLSNPEFLAEGTAIADLLKPDRVLIGSMQSTEEGAIHATEALAEVYSAWVPRQRIITTNLWSAELAKMAANAMLAQRISSINSISSICEATGADVSEVAHAIGLDSRLGPAMLKTSVGFGGSCFRKDVLGLAYLAESLHLPEVASYWNQVVQINEWQKDRFARRIASCMYNTMVNKKVAVFGFAYKKNTGDTRESPAISVVNQMVAERAKVAIYDPLVKEEDIFEELYAANGRRENVDQHVEIAKDPYFAAQDANAVVVLVDNEAYNVFPTGSAGGARPASNDRIDWEHIAGIMSKPSFVFDGRNYLNHNALERLGFKVESIGRRRR